MNLMRLFLGLGFSLFFALPCFAGLDYFLIVEAANRYVASGFKSKKDLHNMQMTIAKNIKDETERANYTALPTPEDPQNYKFIINLNEMQVYYKDQLVDDYVFMTDTITALNGKIYIKTETETEQQYIQRIAKADPLGKVSSISYPFWLNAAYAASNTSYRTYFLFTSKGATRGTYLGPDQLLKDAASLLSSSSDRSIPSPVACSEKEATGSVTLNGELFSFSAGKEGVKLKSTRKSYMIKPEINSDYVKICEKYRTLSSADKKVLQDAYDNMNQRLREYNVAPRAAYFGHPESEDAWAKYQDANIQQKQLFKKIFGILPPSNELLIDVCNEALDSKKDLRIVVGSQVGECTDSDCKKTSPISDPSFDFYRRTPFEDAIQRIKDTLQNSLNPDVKKYADLIDFKVYGGTNIVMDLDRLEKEKSKMAPMDLGKANSLVSYSASLIQKEQKELDRSGRGSYIRGFNIQMTSLLSLYECCQDNSCRQKAFELNKKERYGSRKTNMELKPAPAKPETGRK